MPHNNILNDPEIKSIFEDFIKSRYSQKDKDELLEVISLRKEPDYMFVVCIDREKVLTDQLETINLKYEKRKRNDLDKFGLLNGVRKFIDYKIYTYSRDLKYRLILVFFSDRILNLKAEEIGIRVRLQNNFATLPFVLDA